ncbi:MAG: M28 family peptidase [Candidatus Thermoplasmatota archaeon]
MHRILALFLLAPAIAGCLSEDGGRGATNPPSFAASLHDGIPPIAWNPGEAIDWWEDIASNYPKHDSNLPTNTLLRERLIADLTALGLDVEVRQYPGQFQGQAVPESPLTMLYAVVATKPGTTMPDHRIGLVSHYDTQTLTIHGAYDDASGVAADFHLCKALAQVPMNRTLACIFFDGEERGLVASQRYVEDVVLEADEGYGYDYVLGYDMTGINWPGHPWKLYAMAGELWTVPGDIDSAQVSPLFPFAQDLLNGVLGYPADGVEVLPDSLRNSDERRFKEAGVPIIRFAGGLNATDYDQYHMPLDTVDHVYEVTGGRANFQAGFSAIVEASYATALALDRTTLGALEQAYGFDLGA